MKKLSTTILIIWLVTLIGIGCEDQSKMQKLPKITIESLDKLDIDNNSDNCYYNPIGVLEPTDGILSYDSTKSVYLILLVVEGTIDSQIVLVDCFNSFEGEIETKIEVSGVIAQTSSDFLSPIVGVKFFSIKSELTDE